MSCRVMAALPPLLLAVVGCFEEERGLLVRPGAAVPNSTSLRPVLPGPRVPENEVTARRVLAVGRKLIDANPQAGLRPMFITAGMPKPEITHSGGGMNGHVIVVSDALVKLCKTEAELASVLALEMGKIVAEREAMPSEAETRLPPDVQVGSDAGGPFGSSDGTRRMELAKLDPKRPKPGRGPAPSPNKLASGYLDKAGYEDSLASVAPLLRKAEGNNELEKAVTTAELQAPIKPLAKTPEVKRPAETP